MPASTRWSVQIQAGRPLGVLLAAVVLALAISAAVGASVWMRTGASLVAALGAAALTLALISGFLWVRRRADAPICLAADARGSWSLHQDGAWCTMVLLRFWRGPYWITLALAPVQAPGRTTTLTVWRGALAPADWRKLCVLVRARPARAGLAGSSQATEAA